MTGLPDLKAHFGASLRGVMNRMAKTKVKHTYRNGTELTLSATAKGLRVYWRAEGAEKRHPSYTIPWKNVEKIRVARTAQGA